MCRKLLIFCIGSILTASAPFVCGVELPVSKKLALTDVLRLGFRPSCMWHDNTGMLRCWEKQEIVLKFQNGFEYAIKAENITFEIYDDDQIKSARISGDSDYPLSLDEAVKKAEFIFEKVGTVPPDLDEWATKVRKERMFSTFGYRLRPNDGIRVGVELLPTLQKIDQKPTVLGLILEWEYLGTGPLGGMRSKPVVTPPGFDWDMSYEAWRERIIEKGRRGGAHSEKNGGRVSDSGSVGIESGGGFREQDRNGVAIILIQQRWWYIAAFILIMAVILRLWKMRQ